jgi:flagellar assembly protein FliH
MVDQITPRAEAEAIQAVVAAVRAGAAERAEQLLRAESQLVDLAIAIARRVIAREVSLDPSIVRGLVREGLGALGDRDQVVVRVGTFFSEAVDELKAELVDEHLDARVVVDPALAHCGCVVETKLGEVDESIDERLGVLLDHLAVNFGSLE